MSIAVEEYIGTKATAMSMPEEFASMSPSEIRLAIAELVKQDKLTLAVAATEAALALHADSEDVLVIASLVAEVMQDWGRAEQLLIRLLEIQGFEAPPVNWLHLIRTLRCQNKAEDMVCVIDHVLERFGSDPMVARELETLIALKAGAQPIAA